MCKPLSSERRRSLLRVGLLACASSVLLVPLTAAPSFEAVADVEPPVATFQPAPAPTRLAFPKIAIERDPFVSDATAAVVGGALPDGQPAVRAVVLGLTPKALVEIAGRSRIVGIGDRLGDTLILGIDAAGVRLENGERLPLEPKPR